jgi:hypothetical protein
MLTMTPHTTPISKPRTSTARVLLLAAALVGSWAAWPSAALAQPTPTDQPKSTASDQVDLRPKFRQGQQVKFNLEMDSTNEIGAGEGSINSTVKQQLGLTLKVKQVATNGAATLDLVYDSLVFTSEGPTGKVEFDSTKPANQQDVFDATLRSVVGLTLTLQTDETGKITSVNMLQQFSAADFVRGLFGPITSIKGDDGLAKVGETWSTETNMGGAMGTMKLKNDYTLKSHRASRAEIDMQGSLTLDASLSGMARIRESSLSGSSTWNTEEGMLERMNMNMNVVVETQLAGQTSGSNRTTSKVTLTRK